MRVGLILRDLRACAAKVERAGGNRHRADQGQQQHRRDGHSRAHAVTSRAHPLDKVADAPGSRWWGCAPDDAQCGIGVGAGGFGDGCGDTWRGGLRRSAEADLADFLSFSLPLGLLLDARLVGGDGGEDGGAERSGRSNRGEIADLLADARKAASTCGSRQVERWALSAARSCVDQSLRREAPSDWRAWAQVIGRDMLLPAGLLLVEGDETLARPHQPHLHRRGAEAQNFRDLRS